MPIHSSAPELVSFLNELTALDPDFVNALVQHRPPCNDAIADHPTVQCGLEAGVIVSGVLGVLNGFLGTYDDGPREGWGAIAAVSNSEGRVTGFIQIQNR